jgi:hypothetical protein
MADQNDPFEPFRRFVQQFGEAGGGFDAATTPGMGWPLSPAPIPGMTGTDAFQSPERSTKHAVRQLYSGIDALTGGSQETIWEQYFDAFDVGSVGTPDQFAGAVVSTYSVWLHSLSQLLVESYSIRILHDELVAEGYRHSTATQRWLWGLSQADREELLRRCTGLEADVVDEMQAARERRNELLYTFGSWGNGEFENPLEDGRRYLRVLTALDERVAEETGFSFFPHDAEQGDGETGADEDGGTGDSAQGDRANTDDEPPADGNG